MALTDGASFGRYVIHSLLGSGGMGEVYLARDTKLDRDVALRLPNLQRPGLAESCERSMCARCGHARDPPQRGIVEISIVRPIGRWHERLISVSIVTRRRFVKDCCAV